MAKVIIIIIIIFYGIMIGAFVFCFLVFHSLMIIIQKICACYLKPDRSRLKLWMRESVERLKGKCWFHSRYTKYNNTVFMSQVLDQCVQFSLCKHNLSALITQSSTSSQKTQAGFSSDLMVSFSSRYALVFCSSVFSAVSSVLRLGVLVLLSVSSVRSQAQTTQNRDHL